MKKEYALVLIIAIAGIFLINQGGKEIKKGAVTPLIVNDLTNIDISGLTVQSYSEEVVITARGIYDTSSGIVQGRYYINQGLYEDNIEGANMDEWIQFCPSGGAATLQIATGEYVILIHDGTSTNVYLPAMTQTLSMCAPSLYIASDGSTYYDEALTQDACTSGNGCISAAPPPPITFNQFIAYGNRWVQGLTNTC